MRKLFNTSWSNFSRNFKTNYELILGKSTAKEESEKESTLRTRFEDSLFSEESEQKLKALLEKHHVSLHNSLLDDLYGFISDELDEAFNEGYGCGGNANG